MLCFEGIALNLNVFRNRRALPNYTLAAPAGGELQTMIVHKSVSNSHIYIRTSKVSIIFRRQKFDL
jgi:phenylalanyl-tRNA synthetase beta chain